MRMIRLLRQNVKKSRDCRIIDWDLVYRMVMKYIRTNIYLTDKQRADLKLLASIKGLKPAQLTRLAISEYIERSKRNG